LGEARLAFVIASAAKQPSVLIEQISGLLRFARNDNKNQGLSPSHEIVGL
jgi:hypothetical protein